MPPISVGASVDKMFVVCQEPYKSRPTKNCSDFAQMKLCCNEIPLSAGFSRVSCAFPQTRQSYPRSLLALLWITCSLPATGLILRGLQRADQKTISRLADPCFLQKSRFFFANQQDNFRLTHSYPHLLWVGMWITCSRKAGGLGGYGWGVVDQKLCNLLWGCGIWQDAFSSKPAPTAGMHSSCRSCRRLRSFALDQP